jgi:biopolymer transport protein ExbD
MQGKNPEWKIGIPIDGNQDLNTPNEFQIWMRAIYNANDNMENTIKSGEGIAVKADADTPFDIVHVVLDNLQTLKMNKFSLLTALKTEND